jgi:cytidine deaminase
MTDADLISAAWQARERAYAPYSAFQVGAAILDSQGRVFTGCNVENISYGLTMCAERVAIGRWVADTAAQGSRLVRVAVTAATDEPISPCGACRQVLAEFQPDLEILLVNKDGRIAKFSLAELLPRASTGILNR